MGVRVPELQVEDMAEVPGDRYLLLRYFLALPQREVKRQVLTLAMRMKKTTYLVVVEGSSTTTALACDPTVPL